MEVIVGTAGHIDHGKTALVKALTGVDADRLPEEKRRGITIDIGFAEMLVDDIHFGFVDVPGHERFVKNMLAGASGISLVMLVIAADEGVMPQTREHFDICRLLGKEAGVIVLTKTDLVDAETLEIAKMDAAELVAGSFLENAPLVCVSSRSGEGIDLLKETMRVASSVLPVRVDQMVMRLPVDRSFSMKGFGAVVTGTLLSGEIVEGTELELMPAGTRVRVRGLQTHGRSVRSISAGGRVAVNLGGIDKARITRGMVIAEPDILRPTQILDTEIDVLPKALRSLRSRQRVRIHMGTVEAIARIQVLSDTGEIAPGSRGFAQVRLEVPVVAVPGERFIVRSYSPQTTIAGGRIIDALAVKHRRKETGAVGAFLNSLLSLSDDTTARIRFLVETAGSSGLRFADLQARTGLRSEILKAAIDANITSLAIIDAGGWFIAAAAFSELSASAGSAIEAFHKAEPLAKGISREALREQVFGFLPSEIFQSVLASLASAGKIVFAGELVRTGTHQAMLSPAEAALSEKIVVKYRDAGLEPPRLDDALAESITGTSFGLPEARKLFQLLLDSGDIVKVTGEFYFVRNAIEGLAGRLRQFADGTDDRLIDVPIFKEIAHVSRKYAIPLLEYFDRERVTRRVGDKRVVL